MGVCAGVGLTETLAGDGGGNGFGAAGAHPVSPTTLTVKIQSMAAIFANNVCFILSSPSRVFKRASTLLFILRRSFSRKGRTKVLRF